MFDVREVHVVPLDDEKITQLSPTATETHEPFVAILLNVPVAVRVVHVAPFGEVTMIFDAPVAMNSEFVLSHTILRT